MNPRIRQFVPPVLMDWGRQRQMAHRREQIEQGAQWCRVQGGRLAGRYLYMNPNAGYYQADMLAGTYDTFFFERLDDHDWRGRVLYDIGGHIGYYTLSFAERAGPDGRVVTFEPQPANMERIRLNLSRNEDLAARVTLLGVAASDRPGTATFQRNDRIEDAASSLSHMDGVRRVLPEEVYSGHTPIQVETASLDGLVSSLACPPPDLIKLDVEGAETQVIQGAAEVLRAHRPMLFIEVHSIANMFHVMSTLQPLGYQVELLKEDSGGRCHIMAARPTGWVP